MTEPSNDEFMEAVQKCFHEISIKGWAKGAGDTRVWMLAVMIHSEIVRRVVEPEVFEQLDLLSKGAADFIIEEHAS